MDKYKPQKQTLLQKLENFWYYYKWHTLAILLIICMVVVATHSCVTKEKVDLYVLHIVNGPYSQKANESVEKKLAKYTEDADGNGEVNVQLITISFSEVVSRFDSSQDASRTKLVNEIASGSAILYLFDDENYEILKEDYPDIFASLKEFGVDTDYYDATSNGFFDDVDGFDDDTYYFSLRVHNNIKEDDVKYKQIPVAKNTLKNILES